MSQPELSIITATFNAGKTLPMLISDLHQQSCQNFEWIIADGGSGDNTLTQLAETTALNIKLNSAPDFGIYDALNRGIQRASGMYYLVVGADDRLHPQAVENYLAAIAASGADVITADIMVNGRRCRANPRRHLLKGIDTFVSSHSVGAVFRKSLHVHLGWYSRKLPICADQLFVYQAHRAGARFHQAEFLAGEFTLDGTSGRDALGQITETCRAKIMAGYSAPLQILILGLRLLKNCALIKKQHEQHNH